MKQFFKFFFASVLGVIVASILFLFILMGIFAGIASSGDKQIQIEKNTILVLDLDGPIVERTSQDPFEEMMTSLSNSPSPIGLNNILKNIRKAKEDENIAGIYIEAGMLQAGYATVEEIRNALIDFKESGKFIVSFAPIYSQKSYYLASVSDSIYLNPGGLLEFKGLFSERTFFKGTLEKIGVEMQVVKHGKFKSAVEPFLREDMSEPARLQTETYINSMWGHLLVKISEQREVDVEQLKLFADEMPMFQDQNGFVEAGLIDGLKYKDEILKELKERTNTDLEDDLEAIGIRKYTKVYVPQKTKGLVKDKIAVVYATGEIDGTSQGGIQSDELSRTIREARRDSSIKAIVLRINSPGGSALGSEIIWREVKLASETKPLIVSMGDLAASGGYYIACEADAILAQPTTLTGSIGIFGMIPNTEGLMEWAGLSFDGVKTNKFADMPSITRPFTKEEKDLMQSFIELGYKTFITRCADGRSTTTEEIDEVGQGRVWSGENAIGINLVDQLGGINDAIELAKEKARLETYRIVELPKIPDPFEQLIKDLTGDARMFIGKSLFGQEYEYLQSIQNLKEGQQIQARLPYNIKVY
jgi:protease-4